MKSAAVKQVLFSAEDKLKEAKRELAMRKHKYPGWVAAGTLEKDKADRQIAVQEAIVEDYEQEVENERAQLRMF